MKLTYRYTAVLAAITILLHTDFFSLAQSDVSITEFMADNNKTLADEDGQYSDWIEIYNSGTGTVDLTGWYLTDNQAKLTNWSFPSFSLGPGEFLVVFATTNIRRVVGSPFHTGFKLSAGGEYLALVKPDGVTVVSEFNPAFPEQYKDISYGMGQSVVTNVLVSTGSFAGYFIPMDGSLGSTWISPAFDDSGWSNVITGIGYQTTVPGFAVRNFKANVTISTLAAAESVIATPSQQSYVISQNCSVVNFLGTGSSANYGSDSPFPGGTIGVDVDDFTIEANAIVTIPTAGQWTFGANTDDGFGLTVGSFSISYPNPRGPGNTLGVFNFATAGEYDLRFVAYERGGGSEAELFAASGSNTAWNSNFRLVGQTTNGGLAASCVPMAAGGLSYKSIIATDIQDSMLDKNASLYLRIPFTVTNTVSIESLYLKMKYDDGFVAYLNGQEIASRNAPATPQWDSTATNSHPPAQAVVFETINISSNRGYLQDGTNVLAIHGLNVSSNDTNFLILPELVEYKVQTLTNYYFKTPSPGAFNHIGFCAYVENLRFNIDRGLFSNAISITITSATTNAEIRYTLNCNTPTTTSTLYTTAMNLTNSTVIRADGYCAGFGPAGSETHTYIFYEDVLKQPTNPPGFTMSWNGTRADYGMDPSIVSNFTFAPMMTNALKALPSISLVTDNSNLFSSSYGIYVNSSGQGDIWERPASVEWITTNNSTAFNENCGLRMQGGAFRSMSLSRKHSFRVLFKSEYGPSKLNYDVFDDPTAVTSFDTLVFRAGANDAWSAWTGGTGLAKRQYVADAFAKRSHIAMGGFSPHDTFVHLYLDGLYWGIYNVSEKPDQSFGESYFGGSKTNWDVIVNNEAIEGDKTAWDILVAKCNAGVSNIVQYQEIQGNNPDGSRNPAYPDYLDVDNYIDYLMIRMWVGDPDWPHNNWHALRFRDSTTSTGFKFSVWDAEAGLNIWGTLGTDVTGSTNGVAQPYGQLRSNPEFRMLFADHIYRHMFNGGALTTNQTIPRYRALAAPLDPALVAESARWGDQAGTLITLLDWQDATNYVLSTYLPQRPAIVFQQFKNRGLYPTVNPPVFNQQGGNVPYDFSLTMSSPSGTVYYTQNGTDPRQMGGAVDPGALTYSGPVILNDSVHIKARVLYGSTWSALNEASFYIIRSFTDLLITEIMYHPPSQGDVDGDEYEFLELKNVGGSDMDLSGVYFTNGISYTFPLGTHLGAGQFVVLVNDPDEFANKYPSVTIGGVYDGKLANSGETITLVHASGTSIFEVAYTDLSPWPMMADGDGFSIVPVNPNYNPDPTNASNWRASSQIGGSPGADDPSSSISPIWITEVLAHTDLPEYDAIELYNPNTNNVDISYWYLTDNRSVPKKYSIPAGTVITSGTYMVFDASQFNPDPGVDPSFGLSEYGEEVYLYSADLASNLTGYSDGFAFGASHNGGTFQRYTISTGEIQFPIERTNTIGSVNAGPKIGPVVINEIQYQPLSGYDEFIELKNITSNAVPLYDPLNPTNTWKIESIGYVFPTNVQLTTYGYLLVVAGDPTVFRTNNNVPTEVPVLGPYSGILENSGEMIRLMEPGVPDTLTNEITHEPYVYVPYIVVDEVRYNDKSPWPIAASGSGLSLERISESAYGNDPVNWRASQGKPSPGRSNDENKAPVPNAGANIMVRSGFFPANVLLGGSVLEDGLPNPPGNVAITWSQVSGTGTVTFVDAHMSNATARIPVPGSYVLRMTADDSVLQASNDVNVLVSRVYTQTTMIATGSVWKYLDNGSDQGTNWVSQTFNDSTWSTGPAQLGYGDGHERTVVSYGGYISNRYITTYFRRAFDVTNASAVYDMTVFLLRDAGGVVYLNGVEIFRSNIPIGTISNLTLASWAVSGADETNLFDRPVSPDLLVNGTNVIAVEIHQNTTNNADLSFDLKLTGLTDTTNRVPVVNAGTNFVVALPAKGNLKGGVTDDAMLSPPAIPITTWSKFSGPGAIEFQYTNMLETEVSFATTGNYVLCLSAYDGQFSASNNVSIMVDMESFSAWKARYFTPVELSDLLISGDNADPDGDLRTNYEEYISGTNPQDRTSVLKVENIDNTDAIKISFLAQAHRSYSVVYRDSLTSGVWIKLTDVTASITAHMVEVTDVTGGNPEHRYYRLVTPSQP
ncbi:MAG: lamin tail domain-containing protein [Kiritimatiellae bacterium]|nr:lamin tail domain-containing protein [Kiritimatiellia bacterium]MDD5520136.1 lamin tail domain-containing protein [Kiritimatiellia bacterium]